MIINSLSGGKTSSFMAVHFPADLQVFACVCLDAPDCAPSDPAIAAYAQQKLAKYADRYGEFIATAESDKTLRVMMDLEQLLGQEIVWTRGKSFDQILNGRKTRLPSWARRYCTVEMKLLPIAEYVYLNMPEGILPEMRIGYRADELYRMDNMLEKKHIDPYGTEVLSCEYQKFQSHFEVFKYIQKKGYKRPSLQWGRFRHNVARYRTVSFPLIQERVVKADIHAYWAKRGVDFPEVSNCVGCFHKAPPVINAQFAIEPEKMRWFANAEKLGMGTWHDTKVTYDAISRLKFTGRLPLDHELYSTCDTGGCTD